MRVQTLTASVVADGFVVGEGPRWNDGRFWFSDIFDGKIYSLGDDGALELELETDRPSGLGWLPDGRLLVATLSREGGGRNLGPTRLLRKDPDGLHVVLDMRGDDISFNDMVVLSDGSAYLNCYHGTGWATGADEILLVKPDGSYLTAASGLSHPNGTVVTPDRRTLLVSETHENRVLAFSIEGDRTLSDKRVFAPDIALADGLCLDAAGAVWIGSLFTGQFLRVEEGGNCTHRVCMPEGHWALAPMLGGVDRHTLYMISADTNPERAQVNDSKGFIHTVRVEVPGAGWP
jgi:sugar lactone lactonase YvrE